MDWTWEGLLLKLNGYGERRMTAYVFRVDGDNLTQLDWTAEDLDQASRRLPQGTYTTLRTFEGAKLLRLEAHFQRLERSATALLGRPVRLARQSLRRALAQVLRRCRFPESRLRITVALEGDPGPPATSTARVLHPGPDPPQVYITVEPLLPIAADLYRRGVQVITMLITRADPQVKSTRFIAPSRELKAGLPREIYEVLMVTGDGEILEGFTSNFFAVLGGRLVTAHEGVLEGVTRALVLELAAEILPIERRPPRLAEIPRFDEAFITSSSRGILPVVMINDQVIGDGKPGPVTIELQHRYEEQVQREATPPVT
jgi:branched-chain amino acid aminotransferase